MKMHMKYPAWWKRRWPQLLMISAASLAATLFVASIAPMSIRHSTLVRQCALVGAILCGFVAFAAERIQVQRPRIPADRCPICGYDLRATPERCPECGTDVTAK